jgi:hypothetical protein
LVQADSEEPAKSEASCSKKKRTSASSAADMVVQTLLSFKSDPHFSSTRLQVKSLDFKGDERVANSKCHGYVSDDDEGSRSRTNCNANASSTCLGSQFIGRALSCPPRLAFAKPWPPSMSMMISRFSLPPGRPLPPKPLLPTHVLPPGTLSFKR